MGEIWGRYGGDIGRYRTAARARCAASPTLTLAPTPTLTLTLDPNPSPNPNGIPNLKPVPSPPLALARCGLAPDKSTLTVPRDLGHFEALVLYLPCISPVSPLYLPYISARPGPLRGAHPDPNPNPNASPNPNRRLNP